jgi:hypothetical protein
MDGQDNRQAKVGKQKEGRIGGKTWKQIRFTIPHHYLMLHTGSPMWV